MFFLRRRAELADSYQRKGEKVIADHELRIEKKYDNKHHNSIFFSNPQLLVKKTMKSDISWKVNKSYVELWNDKYTCNGPNT